MKKLLAVFLVIALAVPLLSACAKQEKIASSSSGSSEQENALTADEYFAVPVEFDRINPPTELLYYPENADETVPVVLLSGRSKSATQNTHGVAVNGNKLEIINGDNTRVIYTGNFICRKSDDNNDDAIYSYWHTIRIVGDIIVFTAVVEDGFEIRYAYIYDGDSRLAAKTTEEPYEAWAVSNHEFVWSIDNKDYARVYHEKKENHPKDQDYIFDIDENTETWEINQKQREFQEIYKVYPAECYYIDVISNATASAGIQTGSDMELFTPYYSRWWLDYLPEE